MTNRKMICWRTNDNLMEEDIEVDNALINLILINLTTIQAMEVANNELARIRIAMKHLRKKPIHYIIKEECPNGQWSELYNSLTKGQKQ